MFAFHRAVITDGFNFEGFDDEDVYDLLMEFLGDASGAFMDRIDAEANQSNLDRFDFALLVLLSADHSYEDIARWLRTDEKYVQRKENVIGWRASTFEKSLVDKIPVLANPSGSKQSITIGYECHLIFIARH
jgi:hypothetical protein